MVRGGEPVGLTGLRHDIADVDFEGRCLREGIPDARHEDIGKHAREKTARPDDYDVAVQYRLNGLFVSRRRVGS